MLHSQSLVLSAQGRALEMMRIRESALGVRVLLCACFAGSMILSGCSRSWYRLDADEKSLEVIEEKSLRHPDAAINNFSVGLRWD